MGIKVQYEVECDLCHAMARHTFNVFDGYIFPEISKHTYPGYFWKFEPENMILCPNHKVNEMYTIDGLDHVALHEQRFGWRPE